jgi:small conductance mechanosensitive channel
MTFVWFDDLTALAVTWSVTAIGGIALIVIGFLVARGVRSAFGHALKRLRLDEELVEVLASLACYLTVAVVVIAAFGVMGIETASLVTILGTCTLAIGLALQGSLSNFASGIMLFTFRPLRNGDWIETGDYIGKVREIGVFSTKIDSLQNIRVDIPNAYLSQRPLLNWTRNGRCGLDLMVEISIDSDIPRVKSAIREAMEAQPRVLSDPAPFVGIENFGDSSALFVIRPWCKTADYWELKVELPERIKRAVEAVNATMPTPRREVVVIRREETSAAAS